jgi:hypothetical protein
MLHRRPVLRLTITGQEEKMWNAGSVKPETPMSPAIRGLAADGTYELRRRGFVHRVYPISFNKFFR